MCVCVCVSQRKKETDVKLKQKVSCHNFVVLHTIPEINFIAVKFRKIIPIVQS